VNGTVTVGATVHNESDVGAGVYDLLLKVDGQGRERLITGPAEAYGEHPDTFSPVNLSAGPHSFEIVVDPDSQISELEEGNNAAVASVNCTVGATPTPQPKPADLQISKLEVQNGNGVVGCVAGNGNSVHIVVTNVGDKEIGAVITLQAAVDGKAAGSTTMGGVGANSQKDSYISGVNISRGKHTVQVTLDPENKIPEAGGEGNNVSSVQVDCARN
jgi:subtilase family serine protease